MSFMHLSIGCFFYTLFYTICLFQNKSGITYPFFVGGTLYYFCYCLKRFGGSAKKENPWIMAALMILGVLNCTTDSWVLILGNHCMVILLIAVLFLHSFFEDDTWDIWTYLEGGINLFGGVFERAFQILPDSFAYRKERKAQAAIQNQEESEGKKEKQKRISAIIIGIVIGLPLIALVLTLLCSADEVFRLMCSNIAEKLKIYNWKIDEKVIQYICYFIIVLFATYGITKYFNEKTDFNKVGNTQRKKADSVIAITFTSMIAVIYGLFCGIQIVSLFMGKAKLPEGMTYAAYAREGFFQLLFVCILNVLMVLICSGFFEKNKILTGIMTFISLCTFIMIASSAYRMILYIAIYHLTILRVLVLWGLAVIALFMCGIIYYLYHENFKLFWYLGIVFTAFYISLAFVHPDYWIAKYNVEKWSQGETLDYDYLFSTLSYDAAPILLSDDVKECVEQNGCIAKYGAYRVNIRKMQADLSSRKFNFSRWNAIRTWEKNYKIK